MAFDWKQYTGNLSSLPERVERFGTRLGTVGEAGEPITLLLVGPEFREGDELVRVERVWGENLHKDPIPIAHASLAKLSEESDYKVECPACAGGMLFVARDQMTLALSRDDRCVSCGQRFTYTDAEIGGEIVGP